MRDVTGKELQPGQAIAFAKTSGGQLGLATILELYREAPNQQRLVRVRLASNGREQDLPYWEGKFVVLREAPAPDVPMSTRCLDALRTLTGGGRSIVDIGTVRAHLGVPLARSAEVHLGLEVLVESGEARRAAWPRYAYTLAE